MISLSIDGNAFPEPSEFDPQGPEDTLIKMADGGHHASVQDFGWVIRVVWGRDIVKASSTAAIGALTKGKHTLTWTDPITSTTYTDVPVILLSAPKFRIVDSGDVSAPVAVTFYGRSVD